tara:strand:- start:154 stop:348 length:195 start_codon:yes stop_codon:yes gene_type:complete
MDSAAAKWESSPKALWQCFNLAQERLSVNETFMNALLFVCFVQVQQFPMAQLSLTPQQTGAKVH